MACDTRVQTVFGARHNTGSVRHFRRVLTTVTAVLLIVTGQGDAAGCPTCDDHATCVVNGTNRNCVCNYLFVGNGTHCDEEPWLGGGNNTSTIVAIVGSGLALIVIGLCLYAYSQTNGSRNKSGRGLDRGQVHFGKKPYTSVSEHKPTDENGACYDIWNDLGDTYTKGPTNRGSTTTQICGSGHSSTRASMALGEVETPTKGNRLAFAADEQVVLLSRSGSALSRSLRGFVPSGRKLRTLSVNPNVLDAASVVHQNMVFTAIATTPTVTQRFGSPATVAVASSPTPSEAATHDALAGMASTASMLKSPKRMSRHGKLGDNALATPTPETNIEDSSPLRGNPEDRRLKSNGCNDCRNAICLRHVPIGCVGERRTHMLASPASSRAGVVNRTGAVGVTACRIDPAIFTRLQSACRNAPDNAGYSEDAAANATTPPATDGTTAAKKKFKKSATIEDPECMEFAEFSHSVKDGMPPLTAPQVRQWESQDSCNTRTLLQISRKDSQDTGVTMHGDSMSVWTSFSHTETAETDPGHEGERSHESADNPERSYGNDNSRGYETSHIQESNRYSNSSSDSGYTATSRPPATSPDSSVPTKRPDSDAVSLAQSEFAVEVAGDDTSQAASPLVRTRHSIRRAKREWPGDLAKTTLHSSSTIDSSIEGDEGVEGDEEGESAQDPHEQKASAVEICCHTSPSSTDVVFGGFDDLATDLVLDLKRMRRQMHSPSPERDASTASDSCEVAQSSVSPAVTRKGGSLRSIPANKIMVRATSLLDKGSRRIMRRSVKWPAADTCE